MKMTNEMIANGAEKYIKVFEQIEKMAQTDGSKDSALKLIREVYPNYGWNGLNYLLFVLQKCGRIEGLTIEGTQVMEPIMPKLTETCLAEIEARKTVFVSA